MPPQSDFHYHQQQQGHLITDQMQNEEEEQLTNMTVTMTKNDLIFKSRGDGKEDSVDYKNWGYPGYLTEEEYIVYEKFRTEVLSRNNDFQDTVFSFERANEIEAYALCRWLRARKFDLEATIKMVEEATECSSEARRNDFYPSQSEALGCDTSYYNRQYPMVYFGHARNGCPVFYSKPAVIDINGIETITAFPNILNYHWNGQMHEFMSKLKAQYKSSDGSYKRYACVCILDLKDVTAAQISKRPLKLIQMQSAIDSLCFPETLSYMAIVNAPGFFALTWRLIKSWIDPRTASKVAVIGTNKDSLVKQLGAVIDLDSLPVDYGGRAKSMEQILHEEMTCKSISEDKNLGRRKDKNYELKVENKLTSLIRLRGSSTHEIAVKRDRVVKVTIFIRSIDGAILTIRNESGSIISPQGGIHLKHLGQTEVDEDELPTKYHLEEKCGITLDGPGKFQLQFNSFGSRYKTINVLIGTSEYSKHAVETPPPVLPQEERRIPQVGGISQFGAQEVLISSQSICTGTFQKGNFGNITLIRPTAIIRKEKKVLKSLVDKESPYYDDSSETTEEEGGYLSILNSFTAGCGEFPKSLSKYLE